MLTVFNWYLRQNIYLKLLPFLFFYITICILFSGNEFIGDEFRYITFANNLTHGFYSPPPPNFNLWNGPGYPIILVPFVYLKLPYLLFRLLNAFLLYFSLIISYKTFYIFSTNKNATIFAIILGLYYPIYGDALLILTETLSWFLISLTCLLVIKCFQQNKISWKLLILTAFTIAYLCMTKIIFGYVIIIMLCLSFGMYFIKKYQSQAKKVFLLFSIAFMFCLPWLYYTYTITHKTFYWSNSGSMSLYTMSSPYENELGDWEIMADSIPNPNRAIFMDSITKLTPLQRDAAYNEAALKNIKTHPKKYIANWFANVGRLFFSMPFSNKLQSTRMYFLLIPNMFIIVTILLILGVSLKHYNKYPVAIQLLFIFISIYLLGCTFVSAYKRMFYITMPFWFIVISFFFKNIVSIKIREPKDANKLLSK